MGGRKGVDVQVVISILHQSWRGGENNEAVERKKRRGFNGSEDTRESNSRGETCANLSNVWKDKSGNVKARGKRREESAEICTGKRPRKEGGDATESRGGTAKKVKSKHAGKKKRSKTKKKGGHRPRL